MAQGWFKQHDFRRQWRWSGGAKVLGKLSVPGRPTSLDDSRARAYCACSRCGWGLFGYFFSHLTRLLGYGKSLLLPFMAPSLTREGISDDADLPMQPGL